MKKQLTRIFVIVFIWCNAGVLCWSLSRSLCYHFYHSIHFTDQATDTLTVHKIDMRDPAVLVWVEDNEIRYKGSMFDIAHSIVSDSAVVFIGHFDKHDDQLFSMLEDLFPENRSSDDKRTLRNFFWHFESTPATGVLIPQCFTCDDRPVYFTILGRKFISAFLSSAFQPPELS